MNRDWTEDFVEENGQYMNKCCFCGEYFIGNKHRMICKSCHKENVIVEGHRRLKLWKAVVAYFRWKKEKKLEK